MTKNKNSENLIKVESIPLNISLDKFQIFLKYLLKTLLNKSKNISRESFYKLFPKLPYFAKKKIFIFFLNQNNKNDNNLSSNEFINNIIKLIYGNEEEKLELFGNFFNFNNDNLIHYEDIRLFFYHFFLFSYQQNFDSLDNSLEIIFKNNNKLTISDFIEITKNVNSDLFFLFYFSLNKLFFGKSDMEFFNTKLEKKNEKNEIKNESKYSYENIIEPTKDLFEYINQNYKLNLKYNENEKEEEEEYYKELEYLKSFEDDIKKCRGSITTSYTDNINLHSKTFEKRKISCNIEISKIKQKKDELIPRLSNEFNLNKTDINKFFIYQKIDSSPSSNKDYLFSFKQSNRKDIFDNVIRKINNINYNNCELIFSDNYLLVKYKKEKKNKILIIPLAYSFPNKNKEKDIFETEIISQIFEKEKSFIFQFPNNSKRNTFYNQLKNITNYIDIKEKYNLIGQIGKGAFGQTYLSIKQNKKITNYESNKKKNEKYAIKIINKSKLKDSNILLYRNEIEISKIIKEISHPNIIKIYDVLEDIENIYLIMEYCSINSKDPNQLNLEKKYSLIKQIIKGVQFLHSIGIIHRDIKPGNILLGNDNNYKIIDFGFSDLISPFEYLNDPLGSFGFFPPEILNKNEYNLKIEYWNIGIITFLYLYNYFPFGECSHYNDIMKFNVNKFINDDIKDYGKYNYFVNKMKQIILTCLNLNINERGCKLEQIIND